MATQSIEELLSLVDAKWPGSYWLAAKGRLTPSEPLYGFQVLNNLNEENVLASGEGETLNAAIWATLVSRDEAAGSGDADGGGDGNDDHPDVAAPRAIEGEPTARSAIAPEWWYAAEDPEQSGDFYDAVGDVPYGDPFQVFGAATVKTVWFARLTPAEDSETDDDWECEAASEHECQALIDAERRRRAAATASTEGAA